VNKLTDAIAEFQSELNAEIPKIVESLTDSKHFVRYSAVNTIKTLGERGM
jgi:hypothetical protein